MPFPAIILGCRPLLYPLFNYIPMSVCKYVAYLQDLNNMQDLDGLKLYIAQTRWLNLIKLRQNISCGYCILWNGTKATQHACTIYAIRALIRPNLAQAAGSQKRPLLKRLKQNLHLEPGSELRAGWKLFRASEDSFHRRNCTTAGDQSKEFALKLRWRFTSTSHSGTFFNLVAFGYCSRLLGNVHVIRSRTQGREQN